MTTDGNRCAGCRAIVTDSGYCVMCGRYNEPPHSTAASRSDLPRGWTLLWSSRWYCKARSPEGYPCRLKRGHDGLHVSRKGRGWAWG